MRNLWLGLAAPLAAVSISATAAAAEPASTLAAAGFEAAPAAASVRVHRGHGDFGRHRDGRDFRHGRRGPPAVLVGDFYGGQWALYNNRSWEPDSYNDWWHDRPDRAYPRWLQNNQDCQRLWWGGGGWRC